MHQSDGYRLKKMILPFFRKYDVAQIDYFLMEAFLNRLGEDKLAPATIANYFGLIRKVLAYAERRGFIQSIPQFPKNPKRDAPRGWFTTKEYGQLWRKAYKLAGTDVQLRGIAKKGKTTTNAIRTLHFTNELPYLIVFMVNSFIRPTDIKNLKHKHVAIIEGALTA